MIERHLNLGVERRGMGKTDDRAGGVDSHTSHIDGADVTGREQGWNELGMRPRRTLAEARLVRKKARMGDPGHSSRKCREWSV